MKVFKRVLLFFYLGVVVYYYCILDREKALAWVEKLAVKVATTYARERMDKMFESQMTIRQPASPEPELQPAPTPRNPLKNQPEILAYPPVLHVGHTLKFHYRLNDISVNKTLKERTVEWELVFTENRQFRWEDSDGTIEVFTALSFLPPVSASGSYLRRAEKNKINGELERFFPIHAGKSMEFSIYKQGEAGAENYKLTCTAGEFAPISTPAGTFKTIPIHCQATLAGFVSEVYHYSPQLNHWIAFERVFNHDGRPVQLKAELTGYASPAPTVRKPSGH